MVAQVALSLVLLLGALLFSRTLYNLLATDPGFAHERLVVAVGDASEPHLGYLGSRGRRLVRRQLRERIAQLPEVAAVAQADVIPLGVTGFWNENVYVEDAPSRERRVANFNRVSQGFFKVLDIPIVKGRDFDGRDTLQSPAVAIVSERFVATLLNPRARSAAASASKSARAPPPAGTSRLSAWSNTCS